MAGKRKAEKSATRELLTPKKQTVRELLRAWVRERKTFTLGEAQEAYNGLGGHDKKRDGYQVYHRFSDIVSTEGSGPQGGRYSFTITCTYIGEKAEAELEEKRKEAEQRYRRESPGALWDKLPR